MDLIDIDELPLSFGAALKQNVKNIKYNMITLYF
jgi:hypothetical protein